MQVVLTFLHVNWVGWDDPEQNHWDTNVQDPQKTHLGMSLGGSGGRRR